MKILALLLSLMVLTLTTVPCCALEANDVRQCEQVAGNHTEKEDGCCKDCSPFYVCGTCVGFTINPYSAVTFALFLRPVLHNNIYLSVGAPETFSSIWQPPKLS